MSGPVGALIWGRGLNRVQRQQISCIQVWENKCLYQVCKHEIVHVEGGILVKINLCPENLFSCWQGAIWNLQHPK